MLPSAWVSLRTIRVSSAWGSLMPHLPQIEDVSPPDWGPLRMGHVLPRMSHISLGAPPRTGHVTLRLGTSEDNLCPLRTDAPARNIFCVHFRCRTFSWAPERDAG